MQNVIRLSPKQSHVTMNSFEHYLQGRFILEEDTIYRKQKYEK